MDKYFIAIIMLLIIVTKTDSARLLAIYPTPSISHQIVFRPLTQELVKRGHEVVVITTDPAYLPGEAPVNLTKIDVHNVSYHWWKTELINADVGKINDLYKQLKLIVKVFRTIFEYQLQTKSIQDIVKNKNNVTFDLLLVELCVRPALALSYVYKVPVIAMSSGPSFYSLDEKVGGSIHPILYPEVPRQRFHNLSHWQQVKELFTYYSIENMFYSKEHEENEMLKKYFGPDIPVLSELYNNVNMIFQNTYPLFMDNRPVPYSINYMGGLHQKPAKELPQDLKLYLDSSKNGIIYASFGTNVKTSLLPSERIQMMIKVFSSLPYDVLWKMDTNELTGISKNIKIVNWLPQADLLKHPKIIAFVTQGGIQSTDEAITAGVPLIGMPTFGDQWYNVEKYVQHRIGIKLDWDSLTQEEFRAAILNVIEDGSYQENIRRFRSIINDQPQTNLERAVWWTEHVLRHGGAKHLRAPAANMSWTEYYELELIFIIIMRVIIAVISLLLLLYYVWLRVSKICLIIKTKTL